MPRLPMFYLLARIKNVSREPDFEKFWLLQNSNATSIRPSKLSKKSFTMAKSILNCKSQLLSLSILTVIC